MKKRNTLQKKIVYDTFSEMHNHPSAGMVYEAIREKYPNISKATVYRLLSESADEGEILRLKLVGSSDRYDSTICDHHHIVCRSFGAVSDVEVDFDGESVLHTTVAMDGFLLENCHLEFSGVCAECQLKMKNEKI